MKGASACVSNLCGTEVQWGHLAYGVTACHKHGKMKSEFCSLTDNDRGFVIWPTSRVVYETWKSQGANVKIPTNGIGMRVEVGCWLRLLDTALGAWYAWLASMICTIVLIGSFAVRLLADEILRRQIHLLNYLSYLHVLLSPGGSKGNWWIL